MLFVVLCTLRATYVLWGLSVVEDVDKFLDVCPLQSCLPLHGRMALLWVMRAAPVRSPHHNADWQMKTSQAGLTNEGVILQGHMTLSQGEVELQYSSMHELCGWSLQPIRDLIFLYKCMLHESQSHASTHTYPYAYRHTQKLTHTLTLLHTHTPSGPRTH